MNAKLFAGVDVNACSFTAGADYRVYAATMTGFTGGCADTLIDLIASDGTTVLVYLGSPIPEMEPNGEGAPHAPRSNGWLRRVIGPATAKNDIFAITVNAEDTIVVIVAVDLERGAPEWNVIPGSGVFAGSFILTL